MSTFTSAASKAGIQGTNTFTKKEYKNKNENKTNLITPTLSSKVYGESSSSISPTLSGLMGKSGENYGVGFSAKVQQERYAKEQAALQAEEQKTNRGIMDRVFGVLGYNGVVEGLYNVVDDDEKSNFITGLGEGFKYWNPFTDDVSDRHSFSDVLEKLGWENDEGVTPSDVGRGVVGFLGDVLLDPLTYVGGAGAAAKVVKGTGTAVKSLDTLGTVGKALKLIGKSDNAVDTLRSIGKADDVAKEIKTVLGGVNKSNVQHLKGLSMADARKIIRNNYTPETLDRIEKLKAINGDVIEKQAQELVEGMNHKVLHFVEGGEDLTIGFKNFPFADKIKIGDKKLSSFYKTLATSEQLRKLGDHTVAPYYNRLAKSFRTSRIGTALKRYNELEKIAETDMAASAALYHFDKLKKGWGKLEKDLPHLKNGDRIAEYMGNLSEEEQLDFIQAIETGYFDDIITAKLTLETIKDAYGFETDQEAFDYYHKWLEGLKEFKESSGYNKMIQVYKKKRGKWENKNLIELPPNFSEYIEPWDFDDALKKYQKLYPNTTPEEFYAHLSDFAEGSELNDPDFANFGIEHLDLSGLSRNGKEQLKRFLATLKSQSDEYKLPYPTVNFGLNSSTEIPALNLYGVQESGVPYGINPEEFNKMGFDGHNYPRSFTNKKSAKNYEPKGVTEFAEGLGLNEIAETFWWDKLSNEAREKIIRILPNDPNRVGAVDNFAKIFADIRLGANSKKGRRICSIIKEDTGYDIEKWSGLKLFEDDIEWSDAVNSFFNYVDNNNIEMTNWYDDINNAYLKTFSEEEQELISNLSTLSANYYKIVDTYNRFGEEGVNIAELFIDAMDSVAKEEVERGLLSSGQRAAMRGRYVEHISKKDFSNYFKDLADKTPGSFNPETYGIAKKYGQNRVKKGTIKDLNKEARMSGAIDDVYETSLADLYLARTLGSNKLCFANDTQTFIKNNFFKPYKSIDGVMDGHSIVASYKDIEDGIRKKAMKELGIDRITNEKERLEVSEKKSEILDILNGFSESDGKWRTTYSPNIFIQKLNEKQARYLDGIGVRAYQASDTVMSHVNVLSRTQKELLQNKFINMYDRLMHIWKVNNTIVHPGFHIQNAVSNAYQSFLAIGEDALNMKKIRRAWNIFKNPDPKQTIKIGDKVWTYKELNHVAQKSGVIDEMFHTYELDSSKHGGMLGNKIPAGIDPTNMEEFWLYKWGTKLGTNIEGAQRMNLFISAMGKTNNNIEEAVEMVNKFLFDYSDLTDFEQNVMKRVIPFYTFMRKNLPMELEQLLNNPQLFSTMYKGFNNFEKLGEDYVDENHRNEWRQEHIQIPNTGYGVADQLPYNQFDKVLSPNKLLGQTTPLIKVPYEIYNGQYAYTGMDIDSTGGYFANQTFWSKMMNVADKYDDPVEKRNYVIGQLLGFPIGRVYSE